ncbi:MAG: pitrilysin family protein [Rickettsiales bacterium]
MAYQITTLDNGLRIASETMPSVETVAVAVAVGVGARHEEERENGISHLLEHMAFKGTKTRSAKDIAELFDDIGGQSNAYTSMENTVYYAKVMKENLASAVDILGDILTNSVMDKQELAREQQVILQEIAMQQDTPDDLVFDMFTMAAYPEQALGRSILGTPEKVSSFTADDIFGYMGKHYIPARMVVTAAGNLNHEEFVGYVKERFADMKATQQPPLHNATYKGGEFRKEDDLEQLHIVLGCSGVGYNDRDYYVAQLLTTILGGGMSSRLFQEIREKRGLVYHVSSSLSAYRETGIFAIYAGLSGDKAEEFIPVTCEELHKICTGVTDAELQRAKNQYRSGLLMARENTSSVAEWMARHLLNYDRYKSASEILSEIERITRDDVTRIAKKLFSNMDVTLAALGPTGHVESIEATRRRFA